MGRLRRYGHSSIPVRFHHQADWRSTMSLSAVLTRQQTNQPETSSQTATLIAASLGFAVIQLDVFVVNVGVKAIGGSLGGGTSLCSG